MAAAPTPAEAQLAVRLRQLRDESGLTQAQLATAFSREQPIGAATVSSWENTRTGAVPPAARLELYARLIAAVRDGHPAGLVAPDDLSPGGRDTFARVDAELRDLWQAARGGGALAAAEAAQHRSWFFGDEGPVTIICPDAPVEASGPLADPGDPNYTQLHGLADIDAVVELFGHLRAENGTAYPVSFVPASAVAADHLSGHVVLIGGVGWNDITRHLLRTLTNVPVRQESSDEVATGEIFIARDADGAERTFLPEWSPDDDRQLVEDVGLFVRVPNPFNSSRTLTLCNGIHSRGVLGAVRLLTDAQLRETNEAYLAERFGSQEFAILMRVPVLQGRALSPDLSNPRYRLYEWPHRAAPQP